MDYEKHWDSRYAKVDVYRNNADPYVWIEKYAAYMEKVDSRRALDLGCGDAVAAGYLMRNGFNTTAVDISGVALSIAARLYPGLDMRRMDMLDGLPFPDGEFGVVAAGLSTHYFSLEDTRRIYGEVERVLTRGGIFLVKVNALAERDNDKRDIVVRKLEPDYYECVNSVRKRFFSIESLEDLLDGFERLEIREVYESYRAGMKYTIEGVFRRDVIAAHGAAYEKISL